MGIFQTIHKAGLNPEFHLQFIVQQNQVYISKVISPVLKKQFKDGDRIVKIADQRVSNKEAIEFLFDFFSIDDPITVTIERDGLLLTRNIGLPKYYPLFYNIVQIIVGSVFFFLGLFVIYKRPGRLIAKVWHWASIGAAVIITCTWGELVSNYMPVFLVPRFAFSISYAFVPTLFLHVSLIFPREKWPNLKKLLFPLYSFSIVLAAIKVLFLIYTIYPVSLAWFYKFLLIFDINRIYFSLAILSGIGILLHTYLTTTDQVDKRKLRWVGLGLAIGPPTFVTMWQIPQVLSYDAFLPEDIMVLIMLAVPVTFTIAIVKYHIFDIDLIIQRSTVYLMIVIGLLCVYASLVGISILIFNTFTITNTLFSSIIAAVIIPLFFDPARRYLQKKIDKKFFHVRYNYRQAQQKLTHKLNKCVDQTAMAKLLVTDLDNLLSPECLGFYITDNRNKQPDKLSEMRCENISKHTLNGLYHLASASTKIILAQPIHVEPGIDLSEFNGSEIYEKHISVVVTFRTQQQKIVALLILGRKKSAMRYSLEDIDLLKTISAQVSLTLERITLQKKLVLKNFEAEHLQELNKIKSYFVSSVSHDLQTPLTSIKMFAELLSEKKNISQNDTIEYLAIIQGESERLSRLINNVLDFSKIERGVKEYHFSRLNIIHVVENVLKLMHYQLLQRDFQVDFNRSEKEIFIVADNDALFAAILNIISNAIKYSVTEKYLGISVATEGRHVAIQIKDKGMGIASAEQTHIFETFYRSKEDKIQNMAGAGLGLTLVSHIIKAHHGEIKVTSRPGEGSTFTLLLPIGE